MTVAENIQVEKICMIESLMFYVDAKSVGPLSFLGNKRIRFPLTSKHTSLMVFRRELKEFAGLKAEAGRWPWFMH